MGASGRINPIVISAVLVLSGVVLLLVAVRTDLLHRDLPIEAKGVRVRSSADLEAPAGGLDNLHGYSPNGRDWIFATLGADSTRLWGDFQLLESPEGIPWIVATNDSGEILFHPDGSPVTLMGPDVRLHVDPEPPGRKALDSSGVRSFTRPNQSAR